MSHGKAGIERVIGSEKARCNGQQKLYGTTDVAAALASLNALVALALFPGLITLLTRITYTLP